MKFVVLISIGVTILVSTCQSDALENHKESAKKEETPPVKAETKQEVPTFVCSDGIVREVSPSAILDEMKRCLPPGIPLPMQSLWPELPPNLGKQKKNEPYDEHSKSNLIESSDGRRTIFDLGLEGCTEHWENNLNESKRVSRSEEVTKNEDNDRLKGGARFEGETRESNVFSPSGLSTDKIGELLKKLLVNQLANNTTKGFDNLEEIKRKPKYNGKMSDDDYSDYDYEEDETEIRGKSKPRTNQMHRKRILKTRSRHGKKARRAARGQQSNGGRNLPDYDYDYLESGEDEAVGKMEHKDLKTIMKYHGDRGFGAELVKQVELNDQLRTLTNTLLGPDASKDKFDLGKYIRHKLPTMGTTATDSTEGVRKVLGVVMELNSILVRLLDRIVPTSGRSSNKMSEIPQTITDGHHDQQGDNDKNVAASSILFDIMELFMQKRKSTGRGASSNPNHWRRAINLSTDEDILRDCTSGNSNGKSTSNHPVHRTDMNFLKWLMKWYLSTTSA